MMIDKKYIIDADINIVSLIIDIEKRAKDQLGLKPFSKVRNGDNTFVVYEEGAQSHYYDTYDEFLNNARAVTSIRKVEFNPAYRKSNLLACFFDENKSIWFEADRYRGEHYERPLEAPPAWALTVRIGTYGNPEFINQAFDIVENALGLKDPPRPIDKKLSGKVKPAPTL